MAADISMLSALRTSMRWHQARQKVLSENVANADTVGYQARDLKTPELDPGKQSAAVPSFNGLITNDHHIAIASSTTDGFDAASGADFETTPNGNGVTLEDQMMKLTANQMDYQAATTLYTRGLGLLKTALRKG